MIRFQPEGKVYANRGKETVMDCAQAAGVFVDNICGGNGTCGKCKVKVLVGDFSPVTEEEKKFFSEQEIKEGYRLACKLVPESVFRPCEIEVTEEKNATVDAVASEEKLAFFQKCGDTITAQPKAGEQYGVAIDIGTTNMEGVLWDLQKKQCIAREIVANPQKQYGADVVSRIAFSLLKEENFVQACNVLRKSIREMLKKLCDNVDQVELAALTKIVVVANAAMMHFFVGEKPDSLARAPYHTTYKEGRVLSGDFLGVPDAKVMLLPNLEGFVGADTAGVLAYFMDRVDLEHTITIDIGTNGEMIVGKDGACYVASTAAGPAFEGASISCGMRAETGAVRGMQISDKQVVLEVIGNTEPKGVCGSGLISIVSSLFEAGAIEDTGYMRTAEEARQAGCPEVIAGGLKESVDGNYFILYGKGDTCVSITQKDIRELQLAKAAIFAGMETMLQLCGLEKADLKKCYLAGAFGTWLPVEAAKKIGLLPDIPTEQLEAIGNGALLGGCRILLDESYFHKICELAGQVVHISLSEEETFKTAYMKAVSFPG